MSKKSNMKLNLGPTTYLAGPIDRYDLVKARAWRNALKPRLDALGIKWFDPMDVKVDRVQLRRWNANGEIGKIRDFMNKNINRRDLLEVSVSDFIIVNVPKITTDEEICGTYGEITIAYCYFIPVYIVTDRSFEPNEIPIWAVGCSTAIFPSFDDLIMYLEDKYGVKKQ